MRHRAAASGQTDQNDANRLVALAFPNPVRHIRFPPAEPLREVKPYLGSFCLMGFQLKDENAQEGRVDLRLS